MGMERKDESAAKLRDSSGSSNRFAFFGILKIVLAVAMLFAFSMNAIADITVEPGKFNVNDKLFVSSAGDVGIGTTAPTQKLDVNGNVKGTGLCIAGDCRTSWPSGGGLPSATAGQTLRYDGSAWVANSLLSNDGSNVEIQKNGEVYLNIKNTQSGGRQWALVSAGSSGGIGIGKFSIYDKTSDASRLEIDTSGSVGIGGSPGSERLGIRAASGNALLVMSTQTGYEPNIVLGLANENRAINMKTTTSGNLFIYGNTNSVGSGGSLAAAVQGGPGVGRFHIAQLSGGGSTVCREASELIGQGFRFSDCVSSIKYKENIKPLKVDKNKLFALQPVQFDWKEKDVGDKSYLGVGYIAEEVEKQIPEIITRKGDSLEGEIIGIEYKLFAPYIIEIVKEQDQRIISLEAENQQLKRRLDLIEAKLAG